MPEVTSSDARHASIEDAVRANNGQIVSFSQGKDINRQRRKDFFEDPDSEDNYYVGGMCHFLSLYWMAHRLSGRSFWDWLRPGGTMNDKAVDVIIGETIVYKGQNDLLDAILGGMSKEENDMAFLTEWKVIKSTGTDRMKTWDHNAPFDLDAIAKEITAWSGKDRGIMISMKRAGGGHAMAVETSSKGEVRFFDPNYGEAIFPSASDFTKWFKHFMAVSGYHAKYNGSFSLSRYKTGS
jgi:YopT-type cysteine protease-like protein